MNKNNISLEFFQAVNSNREELAREIVKAHPDVDINSYGAIHLAAQFKRYQMIDLLLSLGADLGTYKLHDSTPLILVMSFTDEKRIEYMKKLLDAGANPDLGKKNDETPLFSCSDVETFNILVVYGANVNAISPSSGWSLLMLYTEANRKELVKLLLTNHNFTLINHCDKYGYSALIMAVERGFDDIMRLLIENGADVNLPTPFGRSIYEIVSDIPVATATMTETSAVVDEPPPDTATPRKKKNEAPTAMKSKDNAKPLPTAESVVTLVPSRPTTDEWRAVLNRIEALEKKVQEQQYKLSEQDEELQSLRRLIQK
eukprot:gene9917-10774_t